MSSGHAHQEAINQELGFTWPEAARIGSPEAMEVFVFALRTVENLGECFIY
jgi:hypothetical protein